MSLGKIGSPIGSPSTNTAQPGVFSGTKKLLNQAGASSLSTYVPVGLNEGLTKVKPAEQPAQQPAQVPAQPQTPPKEKKGFFGVLFSPFTALWRLMSGAPKSPDVQAAEEKKGVEEKKAEEKKTEKEASKLKKKEKKKVAKELFKFSKFLDKADVTKKNFADKLKAKEDALSPAAKEIVQGNKENFEARQRAKIEKDGATKALDKKWSKHLSDELKREYAASK